LILRVGHYGYIIVVALGGCQ